MGGSATGLVDPPFHKFTSFEKNIFILITPSGLSCLIQLDLDLDSTLFQNRSSHSLCDKISKFWMRISSKHQHWALGTCSIHRRTIRCSMKTAGKAIHHTNLRFNAKFCKNTFVLALLSEISF